MDIKEQEPQQVPKDEHDEIYFVERTNDGEIFMMNEKEVQRKFYENTDIYNYNFRLIGKSDGSTLREHLRSNDHEISKLRDKKQKLEKRFDRYVEKHDELLFDEVLDPEDDRVQRIEEQKDKTAEKIKELIEEIGELEGGLFKEAREKELEVAKENGAELPPAPDDIIHSKRSSEKDKRKIEATLGNR